MNLFNTIEFKKNEINPLFFNNKYFLSSLTGESIIENSKLFMEYEGESYKINTLFLLKAKNSVTRNDIRGLRLSEMAEKMAIQMLDRGQLEDNVAIYKTPSFFCASNPKKQIGNKRLEELRDAILSKTFFVAWIKDKKEKEPGCFDGLCLEKNILSGKISPNSVEAKW